MGLIGSSLGDLPRLRSAKRRRESSYDRSGGNHDWFDFLPGERKVIAEVTSPGCVRHIWMTMGSEDRLFPRKVILRAWWDGETEPSVEVPVGDFFGIGHGLIKPLWSAALTMSEAEGRGWNCFFPMPFAKRARFEVHNECARPFALYFYIDYEVYERAESGLGYFHAQWRRQNPTPGFADPSRPFARNHDYMREVWATPNLDGKRNYVILEARGRGHYVGCNLNIDSLERQANDWYGEGDDMVFIDNDETPTLYGTGTEDYFNTAFCPRKEFCTPYHGLTVNSGDAEWPWRGKNSMYRLHIEDPITFDRSIKVTIEHGHANSLSNDYSSTAYWYQTEPHAAFPKLLPVEERLPRS